MKTIHFIFWLSFLVLHSSLFTAYPYRIEISNRAIANTHIFLAGYYGEQISVIDSTMTDADGHAVFEQTYDLCAGIYTIVAPGKLQYDLLFDAGQKLRLEWIETGEVMINGDKLAAAWAAYQAGKKQLVESRSKLIEQYPNTFLATYLAAMQPQPEIKAETDMNQMMKEYRYRRSHFFDNMPLSDVRLLRTPLYHETIHYFITKFVTQQTDSLIFIAYNLLEQAASNCEAFFCVSDFLLDFSLRNRNIKDINKLYNFVQRNRDMIGTKGMAVLPGRNNTNYFALKDEETLKNRIENMPLTDVEGQKFNRKTITARYRVYYFWENDCSRCIADVAKLQTILTKYEKSCFGIAVNINRDVQKHKNRILAYDPLCVNVSSVNTPVCEKIFFAANYSKIVVTDTDGNIIGLFGSVASLDNFLRIAK